MVRDFIEKSKNVMNTNVSELDKIFYDYETKLYALKKLGEDVKQLEDTIFFNVNTGASNDIKTNFYHVAVKYHLTFDIDVEEFNKRTETAIDDLFEQNYLQYKPVINQQKFNELVASNDTDKIKVIETFVKLTSAMPVISIERVS